MPTSATATGSSAGGNEPPIPSPTTMNPPALTRTGADGQGDPGADTNPSASDAQSGSGPSNSASAQAHQTPGFTLPANVTAPTESFTSSGPSHSGPVSSSSVAGGRLPQAQMQQITSGQGQPRLKDESESIVYGAVSAAELLPAPR
jgi:hypothetical protein